jgi:hypothetical protein
MNKDLLVGIGAIIAPVILVFAALTYVSKPAILSNAPEGAATELASSQPKAAK